MAMGVGPAYLCNMEHRRTVLTVRQLLRLSDGLKMPPYRILAAGFEDACHLAGHPMRVTCRPVTSGPEGALGDDPASPATAAT